MSMQTHVVYLTIAYAALGSVLLVVLSRLAIPRGVKMAAITLMGTFNIAVFFWSQSLLGWPAATAVPEKFQVLWTRVVEPNPSRQFAGAIYLWVEELDEHNIPSGEPRGYAVPYSATLAAKAASAQAEIKKGNAQGGMRHAFIPSFRASGLGGVNGVNVRNVSQGAMPGGDPSGGGLFDPAALGGQSKSVDLIPLPRPLLPPKDDP
jgi:hypothetical protein